MTAGAATTDAIDDGEIAAARARAIAASALRDEAARALRYSPHGEVAARRLRFRDATREQLAAETELAALIAFAARERSR